MRTLNGLGTLGYNDTAGCGVVPIGHVTSVYK